MSENCHHQLTRAQQGGFRPRLAEPTHHAASFEALIANEPQSMFSMHADLLVLDTALNQGDRTDKLSREQARDGALRTQTNTPDVQHARALELRAYRDAYFSHSEVASPVELNMEWLTMLVQEPKIVRKDMVAFINPEY